jgi:hypothetical protein
MLSATVIDTTVSTSPACWPNSSKAKSDDRNDVDQSQLLPPVVNDENAHQRDRCVDNSVNENRPMQTAQTCVTGVGTPQLIDVVSGEVIPAGITR